MKIAAIIAEYNPFHTGHEYQIKELRNLLGEDTAIIAIMSGNFTQRGEPSIFDKATRSKMAVLSGANLVLELPFPFSMSSAEIFARAGVCIAHNLGVVDYLCFGTENGDLDFLSKIATLMASPDFDSAVQAQLALAENTSLGYPALLEKVCMAISDLNITSDVFTPNNILGIEYLKSLSAFNSAIIPITIKRMGADYKSVSITAHSFQSASAIRRLIRNDQHSAYEYIPNRAKSAMRDAVDQNRILSDSGKLDAAVISNFRMNPPDTRVNVHDAAGGLYNRLYAASIKANSISSLMSLSETKKFTKARLSRAMWNAFFGVTSSEALALPAYTQVLAMDNIGQAVLKRIKKMSDFPVITKPSTYERFGDEVIRQKELSNRVDSVYELMLGSPGNGDSALTFTPFVKK